MQGTIISQLKKMGSEVQNIWYKDLYNWLIIGITILRYCSFFSYQVSMLFVALTACTRVDLLWLSLNVFIACCFCLNNL